MESIMPMPETSDLQARLGRLEGFLREDANNLSLLGESIDLALRLGKFAEARLRAEHALAIAPQRADFRFQLANICIAERKLAEAERLLSELREAGVEPQVVAYNLAYVYVLEGRNAEAVALLKG